MTEERRGFVEKYDKKIRQVSWALVETCRTDDISDGRYNEWEGHVRDCKPIVDVIDIRR